MRKYILALAVVLAAPTAQAFEVNISGYVAAGVANWSYDNAPSTAPAKSDTRIDDGRYSRIRFSAAEDLGNGFKADLMIEQRFDIDTTEGSTGFANGNSWLGLAGPFGKISLGRMDLYYNDGVLIEISRATSFASMGTLSLLTQWNGELAVSPSRHPNQIRYDSPNFNGFGGSLVYSSNSGGIDHDTYLQGDDLNGDTVYASAYYAKGPFYAGVSYIDQEVDDSDTVVKGIRVYGSYVLPFGLKIGLSVDQTDVEGDKRLAWILPVTYKSGPHAVYAMYGQADESDDVADSGATIYNVGYDYALNKRTSIGINYTVIDNDDNGLYRPFASAINRGVGGDAPQGTDPGLQIRQIYLGLSYVF